jgi:hypothetical protein
MKALIMGLVLAATSSGGSTSLSPSLGQPPAKELDSLCRASVCAGDLFGKGLALEKAAKECNTLKKFCECDKTSDHSGCEGTGSGAVWYRCMCAVP